MFLYLKNETIYSFKFGIVLKLVMSFKTSEKEIWNSLHSVVVVMTDKGLFENMKLKKWNL